MLVDKKTTAVDEAASLILNHWSVYAAVRACRRGPIGNEDYASACREARKAVQRVRMRHPLVSLFRERPRLSEAQVGRAAHLVVCCGSQLVAALNAVTMFSADEDGQRWTSADLVSVLKRAEAMFLGK